AKASDFALYVAVISAILLALVSGTGRAFVGWVSDYLGRRQTLLAVCVILALSSFGVGWAGSCSCASPPRRRPCSPRWPARHRRRRRQVGATDRPHPEDHSPTPRIAQASAGPGAPVPDRFTTPAGVAYAARGDPQGRDG